MEDMVVAFYMKSESYSEDLEKRINKIMDDILIYSDFLVFEPGADGFAEIEFIPRSFELGIRDSKEGVEKNIKRHIEDARNLFLLLKKVWNSVEPKPVYGHAGHSIDIREEFDMKSIFDLNIKINNHWLNFYGKELIDKIGMEKILGTNSKKIWKVENLEGGGILVIRSPLPLYNWPDSYKFLSKKDMKELGLI